MHLLVGKTHEPEEGFYQRRVASVGLTRRASTAPSSLQLLVALPNSEFSPKTPSDSPAALTLHLPALGVCLLKARPLFRSTLPQKSQFGMSTLGSPEAQDALRRAFDHPLPLPVCRITPKPKQATISIFALIKTTLQGYWLDTKYQGKWRRVFYREEKQALN